MKITDILKIIYVLFVLACVVFYILIDVPIYAKVGCILLMILMILINYLNTNNTLKIIINILIGLTPIVFILIIKINENKDIIAIGGEKFNNIKNY